ncbi:metallothionein-4-like [Eurosta solidaginis]
MGCPACCKDCKCSANKCGDGCPCDQQCKCKCKTGCKDDCCKK